ncbi:hypothetical protein DS893_01225 [Vibrionales bacterium C3R12]|nr:hypothetical protein DS893_01225 [Vibrionales bacterium C3R12]
MTNNQQLNDKTNDEKRAAFIDDLFYGSDDKKSAIADEILRLYALLPIAFLDEFDETLWLVKQAQYHQKQRNTVSLSSINKILHDRRLISKQEIASFITSSLTLSSYNALKFDHYKALALVIITQLYIHGDHPGQIENLCNEIRQYAQGRRKKLIPLLPELTRYDFSSLIEYFNELIQNNDGIDKQQHNRLTYYRNPIRSSYEARQGIHRNVGTREFKNSHELSKSKKQLFDDEQDIFTAQITEISTQSKSNDSWYSEDNIQPERSLSLVSSKHFVRYDRHLNGMRAHAINSSIIKNSMVLTCHISHVLQFDIGCLLKECIELIRYNSTKSEVATTLLLMLFTGNSFSEIKQWKAAKSPKTDHIIGIKREFKLPSIKKLDNELTFLLKDFQSEYCLPLPLNLISSLKNFNFNSINDNDIKCLLSDIKAKHQLSLNVSSISQYMKQTLIAENTDICIIELITGNDPQNESARYYTKISQNDFLDSYTQYCQHLNMLSQSDYLFDRYEIRNNGFLGSPFYIEEKRLQWIFQQFNTYFKKTAQEPKGYFSEPYHNMLVLELQMILGLSSGYRPVNDWFGTLNDIHLTTGEYRIADKERGSVYGGRVVILPLIAINRTRAYLQYCERAELHYNVSSPTLSLRYREARQGKSAFCFYIRKNKIDMCTPSSYAEQIDMIFPLQPNWTRHYLRSYLYSQGISGELIAAWLGHKYANQRPFGQFSQFKRSELIAISECLQLHLTTLLGKSNGQTDRRRAST